MTSPWPLVSCNNWDAIFSAVHPLIKEAFPMRKHPLSLTKLRRVPSQFSWVDQRLVREHVIDHLSHPACALYLFLVTVADAQGLSFYADRSLCQRLSMTRTELQQARLALIQRGLVAYRHPLYQVLALDFAPHRGPQSPLRQTTDADPVDIKAVFARIWEVLA
jgi:hypothetical protein